MDGNRAMRAGRWRAHVSAWRDSGQTRAAYCAAHGLSVSAFGYWIRRLHESDDETDPLWVRIDVASLESETRGR